MIILSSPGAVAFKFFGIPIYFYGIFIALATITGFTVSYLIAKKLYKDFDADILYDVVSVALLGGIIFARLYYCLLNYSYYSTHLLDILNIRQGGLAIHGGLLGAFLFGGIYAKIKKYPILKLCDICSYGLILAQAVGRWGNFFNSEAYGLPAKHFIGLYIPENMRFAGYEFYKYFHPTFLYESVLNLLIFLILFFVIRIFKIKFDGLIFASYLILYSIVRFFVEGLRLDCIVNVGALHVPQIVSLLIFKGALIFIVYKIIRVKIQHN
ncbi:prolipoprotein diacylglyceryl transferase [bacterium]|nr:prolipoprotein diacylglyceryl transferase [bacterium]